MNVLIMANYRVPNSGNFIASLMELAEQMKNRGDDVCFLFPENKNGGGYSWTQWLEQAGFSVYLLNEKLDDGQKIDFIRQIVRKHHVDLIHTHFGLCHRLLVMNAREIGDVKILVHDHMGFAPSGSRFRQWLRLVAWSLLYAKNGVGVAAVLEPKSRAYIFCGKHRRWYVPNGVSLRRNLQKRQTAAEVRQAWGIEPDEKVCLLLGWDMYRKGVDIAVKAVGMLNQAGKKVKLALVGLGTEPGEDAKNWIREHGAVDPDSDWIVYAPSTEDIFAYHRAADVMLSASRAEGYPYALLEAVSQNTTIVTSTIESVLFAKVYNKCVYYETESAEGCANAIEQALALPADSNWEKVMEDFGVERWCERMMGIYDEMLK